MSTRDTHGPSVLNCLTGQEVDAETDISVKLAAGLAGIHVYNARVECANFIRLEVFTGCANVSLLKGFFLPV